MTTPHISFSEWSTWLDCSYKHKLQYIDKVDKFEGNEHTAFGKAMHDVCDKLTSERHKEEKSDYNEIYKRTLINELKSLRAKNVPLKPELIKEMAPQGKLIIPEIMQAILAYFGTQDYEDIAGEHLLLIDIPDLKDNLQYQFKGYVDKVLLVNEMYHIIDWKTCSWGWDSRKKSDKQIVYQLVFYKYFFNLQEGIELDKINAHFCLLKRTAAEGKKIELFPVTTGNKRISNALDSLKECVYSISDQKFKKNYKSCTSGYGCVFFNTEFCDSWKKVGIK
jgi:hypothetical protein